jgi:hypothetical protein
MELLPRVDLSNISNIREWWEKTETLFPQDRKREFNGVVIYTMWNLWNERNRRIFEHCSLSPFQIAGELESVFCSIKVRPVALACTRVACCVPSWVPDPLA